MKNKKKQKKSILRDTTNYVSKVVKRTIMMEDSNIVAFVESMDEQSFKHDDGIPVADLLDLLEPESPTSTTSTIPHTKYTFESIPKLSKESIHNAISTARTLITARSMAVTTILQKNEFDQKTGPVVRMYLQDLQQFISIIDILAQHIEQ